MTFFSKQWKQNKNLLSKKEPSSLRLFTDLADSWYRPHLEAEAPVWVAEADRCWPQSASLGLPTWARFTDRRPHRRAAEYRGCCGLGGSPRLSACGLGMKGAGVLIVFQVYLERLLTCAEIDIFVRPTGSGLFWGPSCWPPRCVGATRRCGTWTTPDPETLRWRICECGGGIPAWTGFGVGEGLWLRVCCSYLFLRLLPQLWMDLQKPMRLVLWVPDGCR